MCAPSISFLPHKFSVRPVYVAPHRRLPPAACAHTQTDTHTHTSRAFNVFGSVCFVFYFIFFFVFFNPNLRFSLARCICSAIYFYTKSKNKTKERTNERTHINTSARARTRVKTKWVVGLLLLVRVCVSERVSACLFNYLHSTCFCVNSFITNSIRSLAVCVVRTK